MQNKKEVDFEFKIFQDKENPSIKKEATVIFSNDDQDEEDEEEDDDDETDEDDSEDYLPEDEEVEQDEEGICSLNLNDILEKSSLENSPMVLDDTIKFSSDSSEIQVDEEEELEEAKQCAIIEEREALLVNCIEYKDEILSYMREEELKNRPKSHYMSKQADINYSMRSILIDWLVEVSEEYKLNTETLYLAVNYTDRFLTMMSVLRGKLQLVGTTAMYIAAKYEEISPPDVEEFVYITDDTYTKKQVLRMEHLTLKVLNFRMNTPTINNFLTHYLRFMKVNGMNTSDKVEHMARYLAELTLLESEIFLKFVPSQIAASAIYLSMFTFNKKWTEEIAAELGYDFDLNELKDCIEAMHKSMQNAGNLPQQAIQEKYKSKKFSRVSSFEAPKSLNIRQ